MSRYLASLTEKAQNALDRTGIGAHLPLSHTQQAQQPPPRNDQSGYISDDAPDGRSSRHSAIENITHSLRSLHTQYTQSGPPEIKQLQTQITNWKGVSLDLDAVSRDMKAASKDFYLWGQEQEEDIKDVSDRLAYLSFAAATIIGRLSDRVDASRVPLKNLRTTEMALSPRRNQRKQLQAQIQAARAAGKPTTRDLEEQLAKQIRDDEPFEREAIIERRKALLETERIQFEVMRELGEKFSLIAQASDDVLAQLSLVPPTPTNPYKGKQATAKARTTVQTALDNWKPGMVKLHAATPESPAAPQIPDTRSFGETHATELSRVNSFSSSGQGATAGHPSTSHPQGDAAHLGVPGSSTQTSSSTFAPPPGPPPGRRTPPPPSTTATHGHVASSSPLDPSKLNNAPASIPPAPHSTASIGSGTPASAVATIGHAPSIPVQSLLHNASSPPLSTTATTGHTTTAAHKISTETPIGNVGSSSSGHPDIFTPADVPTVVAPTPTVAETGLPISAGDEGPGPITGSLLTRDNTTATARSAAPAYSPVDRIEEEESFAGGFRQDWPAAGTSRAGTTAATGPPQAYESAEDEKRRLAREDRDKVLQGSAEGAGFDDEKAPAYPGGGEGFGDDKKAKEKQKETKYPEDKKDPRGPGGDGGAPPPGGTPPPYGF